MNLLKVSVVIPTHNNGGELRRAVLSILNQQEVVNGVSKIEIIIVNDASSQEYHHQFDQLIKDFPECKLLHTEKQSGPAAARNLGVLKAEGSIIGFLDADDEWPENKLKLQLTHFESTNIDLVGGKIKYLVEKGLPKLNMNFEDEANRITHVHLGALLVRKSVFDSGFMFDVSLTFSEDVDWWLRLKEQNIGIVILEETTLLYHVHGSNMSVNKSIQDLQLLKVLHQSIKRRKEHPHQIIPQMKDFRVHQDDPLITIILPLYNGKDLVSKTIESVLQQTYIHWELIVVDDGSVDDGAAFIERKFPNVKVIRQKNAGVAAARNTGIKAANGDILAFLDQDDEWMPSKLQEQWELLKKDPYCAFVTCNQSFFCHPGVTLPSNFSEKLMEEHRGLVPSALLIRKHALLSVNLFDESLEVSSDFDLIRRLRKANCKEDNVNKLLLKKWYHGDNASQNKPILRKEILELLHRQIKGQ
jgi:glycosyltransferase involved in cell wall biosynthesis